MCEMGGKGTWRSRPVASATCTTLIHSAAVPCANEHLASPSPSQPKDVYCELCLLLCDTRVPVVVVARKMKTSERKLALESSARREDEHAYQRCVRLLLGARPTPRGGESCGAKSCIVKGFFCCFWFFGFGWRAARSLRRRRSTSRLPPGKSSTRLRPTHAISRILLLLPTIATNRPPSDCCCHAAVRRPHSFRHSFLCTGQWAS